MSTQSVSYAWSDKLYALVQTEAAARPTSLVAGETAYMVGASVTKNGASITKTNSYGNVTLSTVYDDGSSLAVFAFTMPDEPISVFYH